MSACCRRAAARRQLGRLLEAAEDCETALRLEPSNRQAAADRSACVQALLKQEGLQPPARATPLSIVVAPGSAGAATSAPAAASALAADALIEVSTVQRPKRPNDATVTVPAAPPAALHHGPPPKQQAVVQLAAASAAGEGEDEPVPDLLEPQPAAAAAPAPAAASALAAADSPAAQGAPVAPAAEQQAAAAPAPATSPAAAAQPAAGRAAVPRPAAFKPPRTGEQLPACTRLLALPA